MNFVVQLIGSLIAGLGGIPESKTRRIVMILTGVALTLLGGYLSSEESGREAEERLAGMETRLIEKDERITELSGQIFNTVTGGDGFCYLELRPLTGAPKPVVGFSVFVRNDGDYPIHHLGIMITDLKRVTSVWNKGFREMNAYVPSPVGKWVRNQRAVLGHSAYAPWHAEPGLIEDTLWYIHMAALNGIVHQKYRVKVVNGKPRHAIQVFRHRLGTNLYDKIFERIDEGYPLEGDNYILTDVNITATTPLVRNQ